MTAPTTRATLEDLLQTQGKAELIAGRIVPLMPTGMRPNEVAGNIYASLRGHARQTGHGRAFTDNIGYAVVDLPSDRESFSPDASYYAGPLPSNRMRFIEGPPTFAVEVRSENDQGESAEARLAGKRADYFLSGTLVVWDVDIVAQTISCYRAGQDDPDVFRPGDVADAEPAVPGWRIPVNEVFS